MLVNSVFYSDTLTKQNEVRNLFYAFQNYICTLSTKHTVLLFKLYKINDN